MNKYLKVKAIAKSGYFEFFMFIVLITNSVTVIAS